MILPHVNIGKRRCNKRQEMRGERYEKYKILTFCHSCAFSPPAGGRNLRWHRSLLSQG